MKGQKIQNAKTGAKNALDRLNETDYVSIIGFNSDTNVVLPITEWGNRTLSAAKEDISTLSAGGGTDIYKGLEEARAQLVDNAPRDPSAVKRIILLSDGQDRFEPSTYRDLAGEFDEDGLSIMAAGIGFAYDESVMLALANASGGIPADLSEEDIDQFLEDTVSDTADVVAANPTMEIEPRQGFVVNDAPARFNAPKIEERSIDDSNTVARITLPELQVDEPHRLSFEMLCQPKQPGLSHELADLRLVDSTGTVLGETVVEVEYSDEGAIERVDIEKARTKAKVTTDIQDPDISKSEVQTDIQTVEEQGWNTTADSLRETLETADTDGGLIRISKSDQNKK